MEKQVESDFWQQNRKNKQKPLEDKKEPDSEKFGDPQ